MVGEASTTLEFLLSFIAKSSKTFVLINKELMVFKKRSNLVSKSYLKIRTNLEMGNPQL